MDVKPPQLYESSDKVAYSLRYSWCGWPKRRVFEYQPSELIMSLEPSWESDGMRVLEQIWTADSVKILFSAKPEVCPTFVAKRAKGRLDHALRNSGYDMPFSRKFAVRSVGHNNRTHVEAYIERQIERREYADANFANALLPFTVIQAETNLAEPLQVAHGRYWYNLHIVFVVANRIPICDLSVLASVRDACLRIAKSKGHQLSRISVMPDHLHMAIRGLPSEPPEEIALSYQNNLADARLWQPGFYVGTFGEYDMDRKCIAGLADQSDSLPGRAG